MIVIDITVSIVIELIIGYFLVVCPQVLHEVRMHKGNSVINYSHHNVILQCGLSSGSNHPGILCVNSKIAIQIPLVAKSRIIGRSISLVQYVIELSQLDRRIAS